jgi:hypothetical protein
MDAVFIQWMVKKMWSEGVNWNKMAFDRDKWWFGVKTVMNFGVP